ncbi:MAG: polysaccharide deacetylase family protein, partial [Rhodothermales bacterium]
RSFLLACIVLAHLGAGDAFAQILRQPIPDKTVVLTFDDAVVSHATVVAPLLKQYGFGATFYIAEFEKPPFSDKTLYMTWEQIRMLNQMGFEIGNHTGSHRHVPDMSPAEFANELSYIEDRGISLGIPRPLTFAYPAYKTDPYAMLTLSEKGYLFARIGEDRPYDPEVDHPYLVPSYTLLEDNEALIMAALQEAKDGKVVVLTVHGVPDTAHPWVNTPQPLFEKYLRYLKRNGYQVLSMRDLAQYIDARQAWMMITPRFGE